MILTLLTRHVAYPSVPNSRLLQIVRWLSSRASTNIDKEHKRGTTSTNYSSRTHISSFLSDSSPQLGRFDIELVDDDTWRVSSGIAHAWRDLARETGSSSFSQAVDQEVNDDSLPDEGEPDFDEIDNMRVHGNLFYKIDRASKEFEEFSYDFHGRKASKKADRKVIKKESPKEKNDSKESKKKDKMNVKSTLLEDELPKVVTKEIVPCILDKMESPSVEKRVRTPTFNQLTGPYHEPFCLDIYISKASVRACIIHRATSKVVAVAHSISKDMKFDLTSTRNASACAAVGEILAQRALADDIYDVIYTPRKGEKLVGKLQIVLQSIIDKGVNVNVKLKQRKPRKVGQASTT